MPDTSRMYINADDYIARVQLGQLFEGYVIGWGKAYKRKVVIMPNNQNGYNPVPIERCEDSFCKSYDVQEMDLSLEMIRQSWEGAAVNGEVVHIVKSGETLKSISELYNMTEENLKRLNVGGSLQVGQRLLLFSRDVGKNDAGILQMVASAATVVALAGYAIPNMPKNVSTLSLCESGRFTYEYKGVTRTAVQDFCYNKYCSKELVAAGKAKFMTNISRIKLAGSIGTAASFIGATLSSYEASKKDASLMTYADAAVGLSGVVTDFSSHYTGVQIPVIGEFVAYYGICRMTWDTFWEVGRQYGPLKWVNENTGYRGREKRQEKELDKLNEKLLDRLKREGY